MQDWYNINDEQYSALLANGITMKDLVSMRHLFNADDHPVGKLNLMHYIDKGLSEDDRSYSIFEACMKSLDKDEQVEILHYQEFAENGYEEDE